MAMTGLQVMESNEIAIVNVDLIQFQVETFIIIEIK